jgi:IMP dehydrogenase
MKAFTFSDVLIKPKYSEIESRKEVDISSNFGPFKLDLPIISSPMKTITGTKMAIEMRNNGGLGILHRFCSIDRAVSDFKEVKNTTGLYEGIGFMNCCGVSIGVQEEDKERFDKLYEEGARIFCIDIANGFCKKMKEQVEWIKKRNSDAYIIAGNIATPEGARFLTGLGINALRCGIGPGRACMTRRNTGIGVPALYSLMTIYEEIENIKPRPKIIHDGGIKYVGDLCKALKYADAILVGSFVSGASETPGEVFKDENGLYYKVYMGSASGESKTENGKANEYVEGIAIKVPFRGHLKHILRDAGQNIRSSFSYVNARSLEEFHKNCEFIEITSGGKEESKI